MYYFRATSTPLQISIRGPHMSRPANVSDLPGSDGWAAKIDSYPTAVIDVRELVNASLTATDLNQAFLALEPGEVYRIRTVLPVDDYWVTVELVRLDAVDAAEFVIFPVVT